jgi:hypothetical protein
VQPDTTATPVPPVCLLLLAQQSLQVRHVVVLEVQDFSAGQVGAVLDGIVHTLQHESRSIEETEVGKRKIKGQAWRHVVGEGVDETESQPSSSLTL